MSGRERGDGAGRVRHPDVPGDRLPAAGRRVDAHGREPAPRRRRGAGGPGPGVGTLGPRRARSRLGSAGVEAPDADERMDVVRAVRALPRRQREAVVLHYYLDLPVETVARAMRTSQGAVKNALFNARVSVRRTLGQSEVSNDAV